MSTSSSVPNAKSLLAEYHSAPDSEKTAIFARAKTQLTATQFKKFKAGIEALEEEDDQATPASTEKLPDPDPGAALTKVSDADLEKFWAELDAMDSDMLLDEQVVKDFQYVGFNPDTILRSVISLGRAAKLNAAEIKKDVARMCTIAVIKGSITDNNLKKMSDEGKRSYSILEERYKLKRGGSKNIDPSVITIARVGAAFPGSIMKILLKRPELAKKFSGPFGSKVLPAYLRHQSAAACIPESLSEEVKAFLLGLITAFTADQSKVISKSKDRPEEIYDKQENFVMQTFSAVHPTEAVRKEIFREWPLDADYDKLRAVATNIMRIKPDFATVTQQELRAAIRKI